MRTRSTLDWSQSKIFLVRSVAQPGSDLGEGTVIEYFQSWKKICQARNSFVRIQAINEKPQYECSKCTDVLGS